MSSPSHLIPETKVLAIASHVVYGYVGNKVATFAMQALGCDVSSLNTVNYSNHTGYKQVKGTKTTAQQISELYQGLKDSELVDFDMMLSGYIPSAEAVEAVATIGRELRAQAESNPGSFFWVLDPVLGDNGKLYVPEAEAPVYQSILQECDLMLPNQFELETLAGVTITDIDSLVKAIATLHHDHGLPHVFVTSTQLEGAHKDTIALVGSSASSDTSPRVFRIDVPYYPTYFTGTGDLFAALLVGRLREEADRAGLLTTKSWMSVDQVSATELPLAKAAIKVVASMQVVLKKTYEAFLAEQSRLEEEERSRASDGALQQGAEKKKHLTLTRAVELKLVRNVHDLIDPPDLESIKATEVVTHKQ